MKLVPVTPGTLSTEQIVPIRYIARYAHNNQWHEAQEAQAALINAEREVGVRAVVEVLREFRASAKDNFWAMKKGLPLSENKHMVERLQKAVDAADELLALYPEQL